MAIAFRSPIEAFEYYTHTYNQKHNTDALEDTIHSILDLSRDGNARAQKLVVEHLCAKPQAYDARARQFERMKLAVNEHARHLLDTPEGRKQLIQDLLWGVYSGEVNTDIAANFLKLFVDAVSIIERADLTDEIRAVADAVLSQKDGHKKLQGLIIG